MTMRTVLSGLSLLFLGAVSCQSKESTSAANTSVTPDSPSQSAQSTDASNGLVKSYQRQFEALDSCHLVARGIDPSCTAWSTFLKWRTTNKTGLKTKALELAALAESKLMDKAAPIRFHAASLLGRVKAANDVKLRRLIEAAKEEKTPGVLVEMLRSSGRFIGRSKDVRTLILSSTRHPSERVRIQAASWITSSYAEDDASLKRALEMVNTDASMTVRKSLCRRLGGRANQAVLAALAQYTRDPASPMYRPCLTGLVGAWSNPRTDAVPSRAAYALTMTQLRAKPRGPSRPPWPVISALVWSGHPSMARRAPWFNKAAVVNVLLDIIGDRDVHWIARNTAIDVAERLGCVAERFFDLARGYEGAQGRDLGVRRKLLSAAKSAVKPAVDQPQKTNRRTLRHTKTNRAQ